MAEARDDLQRIFFEYDLDKDGLEIREEFHRMCKAVDRQCTLKQADDLFHRCDRNGDGGIAFEEFFRVCFEAPDGSLVSKPEDAGSLEADSAEIANGEGHEGTPVPVKSLDMRTLVSRKRVVDIQADASGRLFLLVFLLYPGLLYLDLCAFDAPC